MQIFQRRVVGHSSPLVLSLGVLPHEDRLISIEEVWRLAQLAVQIPYHATTLCNDFLFAWPDN